MREQLKGTFDNDFGSVDGNKNWGATAILVTTENNFPNKFIKSKGKIIEIEYIGRGGRDNDDNNNKFTFTHNQLMHQNYPLIISSELQTPIRVIMQEKKQFKYIGLWTCVDYKYAPLKETNNFKVYVFRLVQYNKSKK